MTVAEKKCLLLIDGSDRSISTVRYVAGNDCFHRSRIVLFHVFSPVPEGCWDLENSATRQKVLLQAGQWAMTQRKVIDNTMLQAKQLLMKSGIPEKKIALKVQERKEGIARDIITEAARGYATVILRRRGAGALRSAVLGSVAAKLIDTITTLPLILVGKAPPGDKILLAFDGSANAMNAVDFVSKTLSGPSYRVELINVIRGNVQRGHKLARLFPFEEYIQAAVGDVQTSFDMALEKFARSGWPADCITTKTIKGKRSRAKAIADEARQFDFGTIVMGRKGRSGTPQFPTGRVTAKVIHMARDRSVWIIP